jgi:hypothetical protein
MYRTGTRQSTLCGTHFEPRWRGADETALSKGGTSINFNLAPEARGFDTIVVVTTFQSPFALEMMLSRSRAAGRRNWAYLALRSKSSSAPATSASSERGPLADDGRHEVWREGIYDHDK